MTSDDRSDAAVKADGPLFTRQALRGPAWLAVTLPSYPPILLWLFGGAAASGFASPAAALRSVALLAALCGYVSFAVNLVLGARIPPVERLFGALDRMYRFHRRLGAWVAALLAAHVVLITASVAIGSSSDAYALFLPDDWRVFSGVVAFAGFAAVLALTTVVRLRHEPFLRAHRFFGLVFCVGAVHVFRVPGLSAETPGLGAYLAGVTAVGASAWVYRSVFGRNLLRQRYYRVAAVRPVHPSVAEVVLNPMDKPLDFTPGQIVFISIDDESVTRELHPFSITSAPGETQLRLVVKAIGDFTIGLRKVVEGSWAMVEGPYGGFWTSGAEHRRQVWIAGGIGITPFLSIARSLDMTDYEIDLYYCTQDADEAVFIDELRAIADRHPTFRVIPFPFDPLGFLTAEKVQNMSGEASQAHIYICGPPTMLDALTRQFAQLGVARDRLHWEDFRLRSR